MSDDKCGDPRRTRPAELLAIGFGAGIFTGIIVLISTREPSLAALCGGVAFIVALVGLAMLALYTGPSQNTPIDAPVLHDRPKPPPPPRSERDEQPHD